MLPTLQIEMKVVYVCMVRRGNAPHELEVKAISTQYVLIDAVYKQQYRLQFEQH